MRKRMYLLLLCVLCCAAGVSGCRRKPIETEPETQTETTSETQTETQKQIETQKQSETQKAEKTQPETVKKTTVTPSTQTPQTNAQTTTPMTESETPQTQATEAPSQACPYCGVWYYTTLYADGTSDYSNHVAAEEAYINSSNYTDPSYDPNQYYTDNAGNQYAQCEYCFQYISTTPDASGYSPYAEHVAAEAAYAASQANQDYVQCPYCGNWVTQSEYQEHMANGW